MFFLASIGFCIVMVAFFGGIAMVAGGYSLSEMFGSDRKEKPDDLSEQLGQIEQAHADLYQTKLWLKTLEKKQQILAKEGE